MNSANEKNLAIIDDAVATKIQAYRADPASALNALKKEGNALQGNDFRVMCIHDLASHKFKPRGGQLPRATCRWHLADADRVGAG